MIGEVKGKRHKAKGGRCVVPIRYVTTTELSAVGAGRVRDEGTASLQLRCQNVAGAARSYGVIALSLVRATRSAGIQSQRVTLRGKAQRGFTLLELVVVLFVVVLGFSVIGLNLSSGSDSTQLKAAARDIVSALRYARGQALITHQETTVAVHLGNNSYTVTGRDKLYRIPEAIDITVVTAQTELTGEGTASIRFFADGSSSGGRITLEQDKAAWKIDINWLTGQIELESK